MCFLTISGCAIQSYNTEVINQSEQKWIIRQAFAYMDNSVTGIYGKMNATNRFALSRGHIDIAVFTAEGNLITDTTTHYRPSTLTRRAKHNGGVRFFVTLEEMVPSDALIKVAFHQDDDNSVSQSKHNCIICA